MKSVIYAALLTIITCSGIHARGPAVEDFVGIDIEEQDLTPSGTHALFNFEAELSGAATTSAPTQAVITKTQLKAASSSSETSPWSQWLGVLVILSLPVVTWSLTMRHLNKTKDTAEALPDNVTLFPTKVRETSEVKDDDIKKAS